MLKPKIQIRYIDAKQIKGETPSGQQSKARAEEYSVRGSFRADFEAILQYVKWDTGEKNIRCIHAAGSPILNTVIGRMRLSIMKDEKSEKEYCTLKTAQLKTDIPPHATLRQKPFSFYPDHLGFDLKEFLSGFGSIHTGTREEIFNETGRQRNQIILQFEDGSRKIPLAAFTATRIFPLLASK